MSVCIFIFYTRSDFIGVIKLSSKLLKKINGSGSYYRKNFILILFIASIPGLITGILINWFAVGAVEDELRALHKSQIDQRAKNIDEQFKYIEYSATRWSIEPRFGDSLKNIDFVEEFTETYDITKTLLRLEGTHPLIKEVELYLDVEKPLLFTSEYNTLNEKENLLYEGLLVGKNIHWGSKPGVNKKIPTLALMHNIPAGSKHPFGTIIISINREKALELLKTLTPYGKGSTFILNDANEVILSANNTKDDSFENALKTKLTNYDKSEDSFQFKYKDKIYSISVGKLPRADSNWTYVSAAPMSSITAPLVIVSRIILLISAAAFFLAFIMSWIASNRIYSPINRLMGKLMTDTTGKTLQTEKDEFLLFEQQWEELSQRSHLLQSRLSEQVTEIKNSFVFQLVQGNFSHYKEEDLERRMLSYGWVIEKQNFIALDVQLSGSYDSEDDFSNKDESLVTFLAANIMEELAEEMFQQFNVIKFSDLSVGMLIVYPTEQPIKEDVLKFANKVTEAANQIIKMRVTVTLSESTNTIKKINYLFEEIDKWKRLRLFENKNQTIDLEELERFNDMNTFHYPFTIEKEILQSIRMGRIHEVEGLINQFLRLIIENGINEVNIQHGVRQLYSSIQHEILYSGIHPHDLFKGKDMYAELAQIHTIKRFTNWFIKEVILPFNKRLEGRQNIELKRVIEKVIEMIEENYMNDISLESCADEVGTNPYSLSKAFKQIAGINFIDYLTEHRIAKAKGLLLHSTMKINDIAESVGYRHSYFNRIFKKQMGLPPSQYRKLNQEKESVHIEKDG